MEIKTIEGSVRAKTNVKRSVFIATASRCDSVKDAKEFISKVRKEFQDASHNCWAFRVFENGQINEGYSDAGEPSGTAGMPILGAIREMNLVNVAVVVTRYFGGVKLGVRGLIDAYHSAALEALRMAKVVKLILKNVYEVRASFEKYGEVKAEISRRGGKIFEEIFENEAKIVYISDSPIVENSVKIGEKFVEIS